MQDPRYTKEYDTFPCEWCNGTGNIYYDMSGAEEEVITREEYLLRGSMGAEVEFETCETCGGTGEILVEMFKRFTA